MDALLTDDDKKVTETTLLEVFDLVKESMTGRIESDFYLVSTFSDVINTSHVTHAFRAFEINRERFQRRVFDLLALLGACSGMTIEELYGLYADFTQSTGLECLSPVSFKERFTEDVSRLEEKVSLHSCALSMLPCAVIREFNVEKYRDADTGDVSWALVNESLRTLLELSRVWTPGHRLQWFFDTLAEAVNAGLVDPSSLMELLNNPSKEVSAVRVLQAIPSDVSTVSLALNVLFLSYERERESAFNGRASIEELIAVVQESPELPPSLVLSMVWGHGEV